jgi:tyrosine-protein phosphatase SIW14
MITYIGAHSRVTAASRGLAALGVKTIIDLRSEGGRSHEEEAAVKTAGMRYVSVPMRGLSAPSADDMAKVLALLDDPSAGPVFLHCKRGADRTGTVVACYRIKHDRWDNQKALEEARSLGMSWMERAMQHYVLHYETSATVAASEASSVATSQ